MEDGLAEHVGRRGIVARHELGAAGDHLPCLGGVEHVRDVAGIAHADARQREAADVIATQSHTSRALSEQAATSLDEIGAIDGGIRELVQID